MDSSTLLILHSYYRWVVLLVLCIHLGWLHYHKSKASIFNKGHFSTLLIFTLLYNIQLLLGWMLYLQSPLVDAFLNNIAEGTRNRQLRFFGLEHVTMMSTAILLFNISLYRCRRKIGKPGVFHALLIWFYILLFLVLSSIPWSFSPLTSRPNFR